MTVEGLLKRFRYRLHDQKKKGSSNGVVNNLFKVYFSNNAVRLCGNTFKSFKIVFRSIDFDICRLRSVLLPFYEGRLAIFQRTKYW